MKTKINRRTFLKATAVTTAGAFTLPRFSIGQAGPSANSKINIAMIGAAGIAGMAYNGCKGENIVALCDIDRRRFPEWAARKGTPTYSDFRVMLDKMGSEIDAVCINTPDHTHFAATMDSMQRGKHVCTQKLLLIIFGKHAHYVGRRINMALSRTWLIKVILAMGYAQCESGMKPMYSVRSLKCT